MNGFDPVRQAERKLAEIGRTAQFDYARKIAESSLQDPILVGQELLRTGAFTWIPMDGHGMFIGEMSDRHLLNTLKKRLRENRTDDDRFKLICYELARRAFFKEGGKE